MFRVGFRFSTPLGYRVQAFQDSMAARVFWAEGFASRTFSWNFISFLF